ncbi:carboxy terminal-processing peptidase [soil metagenome]
MRIITIAFFLMTAFIAKGQQKTVISLHQKAIILKRFLEKNHYKPLVWNDSSSILLYTKWMEELDEEKLFFTQKDMASLEPYQYRLDDEILAKELPATNFFSLSVSLFQLRLQKTDSIIQGTLAKPFDFAKPDNISWPFKTYAINEQDAALRWQKFLKWRVLEYIADELAGDEKTISETTPADFSKLEAKGRAQVRLIELAYIKSQLRSPKEFISGKEDAYMNAIAWCYDPHTSYMNLKEKNQFETAMSASEFSSGLDLEENEKGDQTINYLQPGGSAWRSGQLHKGDILVKVKANGTEKKVADIAEDELNGFLSGTSEGAVEVTVKTAAGEVKNVKLVKEKISDEESIVKSYVLHGNKNIGYINLPGFYSRESESVKDAKDITYDGCANDVSKEIVKLKKDTIAGLILDLRYNGGGSMWEAMQLAGIFIDIGPVASMKDKDGKVHFLKDPNRGTVYDGPLVVLINGASASASEFVSAVLQDYNRALIVGGTTYGKGTAQEVLPMDTAEAATGKKYEDFVKVTENKFYRVNGSTTQWKGVIPDISLPDMYSDDSFKEKANASALTPDNSKTGIYQQLPALPIATLRSKSESRIAADLYFKTMSDFSNWIRQYKAGRIIPLQWAGYALHYKKTLNMFKMIGDDHSVVNGVAVSNNSFDTQRIKLSSIKSREINDTYLGKLQNDHVINEAYRIMMDWKGN